MTAATVSAEKAGNAAPALSLTGATMSFGGVTVLHDASLTLKKGEIRALVGKNGSGKSTLIKILSGFHRPSSGTRLDLGGRILSLPAFPETLRESGLSFVHQDLGLIPESSILDNILVGRFGARGIAPIAWSWERARVSSVLERFGVRQPPELLVSELSTVERALVAISRGFVDAQDHGGVIVLDEPTAFLPEAEVERLFVAIRELALAGASVLYVSHRLDEVLALADSVTVLRDGRVVHEGFTADLDEDRLIRHILGEDIKTFYPDLVPPRDEVALNVEGLSGSVVRDLSLSVRCGEIVGVTGLGGAGYEELPYLLTGAAPASAGRLDIGGRSFSAQALRPHLTRKLGLALLPADRQRASGAQRETVKNNVSLPVLSSFFRWGFLRSRAERRTVRALLLQYGVQPANPDALMRTLSGGNQQKALLAKWMQTNPGVLILHEPTQGVDVGSKQDIFRKIEEFASSGIAIIIASAETEDLANLCHRVVVLRRGGFAGELAGADLAEQAIDDLAFRDRATGIKDNGRLS